jgi:hypothetical protein
MQFGKDAKFATHVVGGSDFAAEGWTPKNKFTRSELNKVGEVRMAARVLADDKRSCFIGKVAAKKWFELGEVEFFAGPNGSRLILWADHFVARSV